MQTSKQRTYWGGGGGGGLDYCRAIFIYFTRNSESLIFQPQDRLEIYIYLFMYYRHTLWPFLYFTHAPPPHPPTKKIFLGRKSPHALHYSNMCPLNMDGVLPKNSGLYPGGGGGVEGIGRPPPQPPTPTPVPYISLPRATCTSFSQVQT